MNEETKKARSKLKNIATYKTFNEVLDDCILKQDERKLIELYYLHDKPISVIADELGVSESTVKRIHSKALKKISKRI